MCRDSLKVGTAATIMPTVAPHCAFHLTNVCAAVPGFQDAVRGVILSTYARTCQSVSKAALADSLRLDSAAVDQLVRLACSLQS